MTSKLKRKGKGVVKPKVSAQTIVLAEQHRNMRLDYRWFSQTALREKYFNKYIAMQNQGVILVEDNIFTLRQKLKDKGLNPNTTATMFVSEHPECYLL